MDEKLLEVRGCKRMIIDNQNFTISESEGSEEESTEGEGSEEKRLVYIYFHSRKYYETNHVNNR